MADFLLKVVLVLLVLPRTHYYGGRRSADERSRKKRNQVSNRMNRGDTLPMASEYEGR
jgi:hypothetical protein